MPTVLTPIEARVIGALMEKEVTTPDTYPLSLNALTNACNQKSSRDPVMELTEADVRTALFSLDEASLVRTLADARVTKFEHRTRDRWNLRRDEFAIICLLLLRGPQTAAELRTRAERLYTFDDTAAAQATLERLSQRGEDTTGPLVTLLPRQPGAREARWAHLLSGEVDTTALAPATAAATHDPALPDRIEARIEIRIEALEARIAALEEKLSTLLN